MLELNNDRAHKTRQSLYFSAAKPRSSITNRLAQLLYRLANASPLLLEVKLPKQSMVHHSVNLKGKCRYTGSFQLINWLYVKDQFVTWSLTYFPIETKL